jgi:antitoxin (DNA-binding transcriptional repressor) of toxin-antitoxin stability system
MATTAASVWAIACRRANRRCRHRDSVQGNYRYRDIRRKGLTGTQKVHNNGYYKIHNNENGYSNENKHFTEGQMRFITVTQRKQRATQIVSQIQASGEEMVITKIGKPVVQMRIVDEKEIVLMASMEFKQGHGAIHRQGG